MGVLSGLEPARVFANFEALCSVPHGSGNTKQISDLCVRFAEERGLEHRQDALGNVMIFAPATPGYEEAEPIILQGHLDMVCVKTDDCDLDMMREGLRLRVDGDWVSAEGTSLGGDDGIAVAMAMAVLESRDLPHPRIEALFTVDEETGMFGAAGVDLAPLQGRKLINIDSEDEGIFTVGCAGGMRADCTLPVARECTSLPRCRVTVEGLKGGHSGVEIHTGRGNANKLMGEVLALAAEKTELMLLSLAGGSADNVIAKSCEAVVAAADPAAVSAAASEAETTFRARLGENDPGVTVRCEALAAAEGLGVGGEDLRRCLVALNEAPQGVRAMSEQVPGLVQTSLNLGVLELGNVAMRLRFSLRSSVAAEKTALLEELRTILRAQGGDVATEGDYPPWEYREASPLRDLMVEVFTEQYGHAPKIEIIHAGLECGLLSGKRPELDCVSIGPDLLDIHSVNERMSISSVQRTWAFLTEVLKRSK